MNNEMRVAVLASVAVLSLGLSGTVQAEQAGVTFFVTSVGSGDTGLRRGPLAA